MRSSGRPSMTTIVFLLWLITFRLDVGAQSIVMAWLVASACFFLWRGEWRRGVGDNRSLTSTDCPRGRS